MRVSLTIVAADGAELPAGSPVRVQLRDTSFEDAPARTLQEWRAVVPEHAKAVPLSIEIDAGADDATFWVHVDRDGDRRVSVGDYITTRAYPLRTASAEMTLVVSRID
ncbi:YbaY family lipoprotein [Lysobacter antibioticus]|uniref:YbaY family lipoprotein n=1 Tax=Lysobacter antibioticus TaxID=84531 RepID=UPI0007164D37|nr:YbaY family lipoprotein [Lysobacter antibioticus]